MQGVVQKLGKTRNNAPTVTIDGQSYFYGRDVKSFPEVGQKIEFEWEHFGDDRGQGRPRSIQKWRPVVNGTTGQPETGSTISDVDVLRSVSNVVGSACAAGTIKDPVELEKWFVVAFAGLTRRQRSATGREPGMDDDLPDSFYGESENPAPKGNTSGNWQ